MNIRELINALEEIIATDPNVSDLTEVGLFCETKDETGQYIGISGGIDGMGYKNNEDKLELIAGDMPETAVPLNLDQIS